MVDRARRGRGCRSRRQRGRQALIVVVGGAGGGNCGGDCGGGVAVEETLAGRIFDRVRGAAGAD